MFQSDLIIMLRGFAGGPGVKNLPSNAGDAGSIPVWGTKGNLLQGNCLARLQKPEYHKESQHSQNNLK